jgi:hypothetical protein
MKFNFKDWLLMTVIVLVFTNLLLWFGVKGDKMDSMIVGLRWLMSLMVVFLTSFVMISIELVDKLCPVENKKSKGCSCCHH